MWTALPRLPKQCALSAMIFIQICASSGPVATSFAMLAFVDWSQAIIVIDTSAPSVEGQCSIYLHHRRVVAPLIFLGNKQCDFMRFESSIPCSALRHLLFVSYFSYFQVDSFVAHTNESRFA